MFILILMLTHMCILSIFVSHFTYPHILSSEWALQKTELSTFFKCLDGTPLSWVLEQPSSSSSRAFWVTATFTFIACSASVLVQVESSLFLLSFLRYSRLVKNCGSSSSQQMPCLHFHGSQQLPFLRFHGLQSFYDKEKRRIGEI